MANNTGTLVTATVRPQSDLDTIAVIIANEAKGGAHCVADNSARDAIPAERRAAGMTCYVLAGSANYRLGGDLLTWTRVRESRYGMITRITTTGSGEEYRPAADSDESRWLALKQALSEVTNGDSVHIDHGRCLIPVGQCMSQWIPSGRTGVRVVCMGDQAAHIYGTPTKAGDDAHLFDGVRYVVNFGAVPSVSVESLPAFIATRHSFPLYGGGAKSEGAPGLGSNALTDIDLRIGEAVLSPGVYRVSGSFFQQAFQEWRGEGGRVAVMFSPGIAPLAGGVVKYAWGTARSVQGGVPQGNFTHNCITRGIIFYSETDEFGVPLPGNELLSGGLFYGAQASVFANLGFFSFGGGPRFGQTTDLTTIEHLDIGSISGRAGEGIGFFQCNLVTLKNVSIVNCNIYGTYLDAQGHIRGTYRMDDCKGMVMDNCLAESCARGVVSYGSVGLVVRGFEFLNILDSGNKVAGQAGFTGNAPHADAVAFDLYYSSEVEIYPARTRFATAVRQDGVIVRPGQGASYSASSLTATDYCSNKFISRLAADDVRFSSIGEGATWEYAGRLFRISVNQAAENPGLICSSSLPDGTDVVQHFNFARANGSIHNGWKNIFADGFFTGGVNSEIGFAVNRLNVVGPRALPIATPAGGATVDAEARTAIAAILTMLRTDGKIATS